MGPDHPRAPSPGQRWLMAGNRQPPLGKGSERAAAGAGVQGAGKPPVRGRWRSDQPQRRAESSPVAALERALAALGREVRGAKAELEAALQRAREKAKVVAPSRAPVPEVTIEAARARVVRLEAALAALVDHSGPVDGRSSIRHACCCRSWAMRPKSAFWQFCWQKLDSEPVHGQQHGDMMCDEVSWRTVSARYGLRGVRIGECIVCVADAVPHSRSLPTRTH